MTQLPLAAESIDRITFNASLHHTPDLRRTLAECARVLKPDGIIAMVNEEFGSVRHRLMPAGECSDTGSHHAIPYTAFEEAAHEAGFAVSYALAEHVRVTLRRKLPGPVAGLAARTLESPGLLKQLNSALILMRKTNSVPPAMAGRADSARPAAQAAAPETEAAPPVVMLGVPFDNVTTAQTLELVDKMVASRQPHHLVTPNVDFLTQALRDVELHRILTEAHLVLCDGMPLVWASRLLGNPLPERVAGSDLVPLLISAAARTGVPHFPARRRRGFDGASGGKAREAVSQFADRRPLLAAFRAVARNGQRGNLPPSAGREAGHFARGLWLPQARKMDCHASSVLGRARGRRGRGNDRFPRRQGAARSALDAGSRLGMGLPPPAGAAPLARAVCPRHGGVFHRDRAAMVAHAMEGRKSPRGEPAAARRAEEGGRAPGPVAGGFA